MKVSSLSALGKVSLYLAELGKIESCYFLGFFNLLLVRLDLSLELINQSLHALMVLSVLILGVGQLLDMTLRFAPVFSIKLRFKFTNPCVHLSNGFLASLQGILFSLIKAGLSVLYLCLKKFRVPLKHHCHLLFTSEFISKAGSIDHGSLSFLL